MNQELIAMRQRWRCVGCFLSGFAIAGASVMADSAMTSTERATKSMQVVGNHLMIAGGGYGVQVLNISNPAKPSWKGSWNPRRCPTGIQLVGHYGFVADRLAGLTILNITNFSRPQWIATVDTPGDARSLHVVNDHAYVADGAGSGLLVFNVSDPRQPQLMRKYDQELCPYTIQVVGETAYINSAGPIKLLNIANPTNRPPVVSLNSGGAGYSQAAGSFHFVPSVSGLLVFPSLSNMLLGRCREGAGNSIFVRGDRAFVASVRGLSILDVNNPAIPHLIAEVDVGTPQGDVVVAGNYAYLLDNGVNLRVFDISNIQYPRQVGFFPSTKYSSSPISFSDHVADSDGKLKERRSKEHLLIQANTNQPPRLEQPRKHKDGHFAFILEGLPQRTYIIEASTNLTDWIAISTNALPTTGSLEINDQQAGSFSQRYYRAIMTENRSDSPASP